MVKSAAPILFLFLLMPLSGWSTNRDDEYIELDEHSHSASTKAKPAYGPDEVFVELDLSNEPAPPNPSPAAAVVPESPSASQQIKSAAAIGAGVVTFLGLFGTWIWWLSSDDTNLNSYPSGNNSTPWTNGSYGNSTGLNGTNWNTTYNGSY